MLGSVKSKKRSWSWMAHGKHPVARDYFRVGEDLPIFRAFSDWVDKGNARLMSDPDRSPGFCSWRFWSRGLSKDHSICGVARASGDSLGRPHPLLIMGAGPLKCWPDCWDQAPLIFEKSWSLIDPSLESSSSPLL